MSCAVQSDERGPYAECGMPVWLDPRKGLVCAHNVTEWWHVWAGVLGPGAEHPDEEPTRVHVTLGPTRMSPDDHGMDGRRIPIRERTLPFQLVEDDPAKRGPELVYLASFTHEPDDDDIEPLREEKGL